MNLAKRVEFDFVHANMSAYYAYFVHANMSAYYAYLQKINV